MSRNRISRIKVFSNSDNNYVNLFESEGYEGKVAAVAGPTDSSSTTTYNHAHLDDYGFAQTGSNDAIRGLTIPKGYGVTLFTGNYMSGTSYSLYGPTENDQDDFYSYNLKTDYPAADKKGASVEIAKLASFVPSGRWVGLGDHNEG